MPKKEQVYIVDGFAFTSESEAEKARKEKEGIRYIKGKIDVNKPDIILQLYNKMVRDKMFVTSVGYAYLADLQEYLHANPAVSDEDILPIEVVHPAVQETLNEERYKYRMQIRELKKKADRKSDADTALQNKYRLSLLGNLILVLSVIGMFLISATSDHPTVLNYENELINRYSAWEQELSEREAALREAENR